MISNEKMFYHLDRYFTNKKPITADIFLNNYCNNACPYCTYKRYGDVGSNYMTYKDFLIYIKILLQNGVKGVILTGGGEPTISKDFDKITKWLEDNNVEYGINTNFNVLKYIKPKFLKVSLDGYDRSSYIKNRGVDKYDQVIDNIKNYLKWKKENNVQTSVGVQCIGTELNEVIKFYNSVKELDIDYMNIRPMESTTGIYYQDQDNIQKKEEILHWLEQKQKEDSRIIINYKWYETETKFEKCYSNFAQIALNEKGEVIYCCHKPYEKVGHITDTDIWEKREHHITNIQMCDVPCRLTAPNSLVRKLEKKPKDVNFI